MWKLLVSYISVFLQLQFISSMSISSHCGVGGVTSGLVVNGTQSEKGQWPWLVGLFKFQSNEFFCGGALISENMILTVSEKNKIKRIIFNFMI
jgi:secreted trypsin-like serine protease